MTTYWGSTRPTPSAGSVVVERTAECWSCGLTVTKEVEDHDYYVHWECDSCDVAWRETVRGLSGGRKASDEDAEAVRYTRKGAHP